MPYQTYPDMAYKMKVTMHLSAKLSLGKKEVHGHTCSYFASLSCTLLM